jgi:hypothetical protein
MFWDDIKEIKSLVKHLTHTHAHDSVALQQLVRRDVRVCYNELEEIKETINASLDGTNETSAVAGDALQKPDIYELLEKIIGILNILEKRTKNKRASKKKAKIVSD